MSLRTMRLMFLGFFLFAGIACTKQAHHEAAPETWHQALDRAVVSALERAGAPAMTDRKRGLLVEQLARSAQHEHGVATSILAGTYPTSALFQAGQAALRDLREQHPNLNAPSLLPQLLHAHDLNNNDLLLLHALTQQLRQEAGIPLNEGLESY